MEKFLMALKTEGFQGLAYVLTSASSSSSLVEDGVGGAHSSEEDAPPPSLSLSASSSSSELTRDQAKLEKAAQNWLDRKRFAHVFFAAGPTRPAFLCIVRLFFPPSLLPCFALQTIDSFFFLLISCRTPCALAELITNCKILVYCRSAPFLSSCPCVFPILRLFVLSFI